MEHYSNFWTFEIASLPNVPGHYLRKYGIYRHQRLDSLQWPLTKELQKISSIYSKLYVNNRITFIQVYLNAASDLQYFNGMTYWVLAKELQKTLQYLQ